MVGNVTQPMPVLRAQTGTISSAERFEREAKADRVHDRLHDVREVTVESGNVAVCFVGLFLVTRVGEKLAEFRVNAKRHRIQTPSAFTTRRGNAPAVDVHTLHDRLKVPFQTHFLTHRDGDNVCANLFGGVERTFKR